MATTTLKPNDVPTTANVMRRSGRAKKAPRKYDEEYIFPSQTNGQQTEVPTRTNPKRRAAEAALENIEPEETAVLQEQNLARMDIDERKEYRGWVQLESEPAFFNAMLQDLNAKDLKVQEVFGLDETMLADLPKPVYGLIFLYEWTNEDESNEARQECPEHLWFGNQTTANACATVALMNIIMNAHGVRLGPELEAFRDITKGLSPPHRGHALNTNDFIRAIHNSVARRNDLLSEDLLLENKYRESFKKKKPAKRKRLSKPSKKDYESGTYHYIAFVPVDGQVWELDGLESKPLCLGEYTEEAPDSWLNIASSAIQKRMAQQDNEYLSFNLLAACQSPLVTISRNLATSLATFKALDDVVRGNESWDNVRRSPWEEKFTDEYLLPRFGLTRSHILSEFAPRSSFESQVSDASFNLAAAQRLADELRAEQDALDARYAAEVATVDEAVEMIRGRQRDYTPAVHEWVRILAEKGVLRELIHEMDLASAP